MKNALHHIIVLILSIASLLFMQVGFIFFLLAFMPSIIAYFYDSTPQKNIYKVIRAFNIAGVLPLAFSLFNHSNLSALLQVKMTDIEVWKPIFGAAFAGWILLLACKWITYFIMMTSGSVRIENLKEMQKQLVEEWGESIKQGLP